MGPRQQPNETSYSSDANDATVRGDNIGIYITLFLYWCWIIIKANLKRI